MKIVQKIWAELSAQPKKVELAVSDKLVYAKGVRTFGKNIDIDIKELETVNRSLSVDVDDLRQDMKALSKGVSEVESAAKELGVNKYTQDIYIKTQEVENTINRVEKVQKEVGEDFGVIPKWKNELKEIERYFKQLSDWQDKIKSIQKPSR